MTTPPGTHVLGCHIGRGDRIAVYHLGGDFLVERIDPEPHRTAAGETARCAYDHGGRGLVVFCDDSYPLVDDVELTLFETAA